jgi:hypothetical protein
MPAVATPPRPTFQGAMMPRNAVALVLAVLLAGLGGCAPDSVTNRQATGFNAFLDKIAFDCKPLQIGRYQMTQMIQRNAIDDNYIYFLDQTSRVYYGTITQAAYRSSIDGFFLGGSTNLAIDCILSKLPQSQ